MPHPAVDEYLKPMQRPLIVEFRTEAVKLEAESVKQGRPVFKDQDFVTILIPGMRGTTAHSPVTEEHIERFPVEYAAFKAGQEAPLSGTPLTDWPNSMMTKAMVQELAYFNVKTVEQLATLDDAAVQRMGRGILSLRQTAGQFLEVAKTGTAPLERMLRQIDTLAEQVELQGRTIKQQADELQRLRAQQEGSSHAQFQP